MGDDSGGVVLSTALGQYGAGIRDQVGGVNRGEIRFRGSVEGVAKEGSTGSTNHQPPQNALLPNEQYRRMIVVRNTEYNIFICYILYFVYSQWNRKSV